MYIIPGLPDSLPLKPLLGYLTFSCLKRFQGFLTLCQFFQIIIVNFRILSFQKQIIPALCKFICLSGYFVILFLLIIKQCSEIADQLIIFPSPQPQLLRISVCVRLVKRAIKHELYSSFRFFSLVRQLVICKLEYLLIILILTAVKQGANNLCLLVTRGSKKCLKLALSQHDNLQELLYFDSQDPFNLVCHAFCTRTTRLSFRIIKHSFQRCLVVILILKLLLLSIVHGSHNFISVTIVCKCQLNNCVNTLRELLRVHHLRGPRLAA